MKTFRSFLVIRNAVGGEETINLGLMPFPTHTALPRSRKSSFFSIEVCVCRGGGGGLKKSEQDSKIDSFG